LRPGPGAIDADFDSTPLAPARQDSE
jgi:hypothetical protein